jgi:hypothetical protein
MQAPPPAPKAITCANCGTENPGSNSNCSNCGAALPKSQAPVAQAKPPAKTPEKKKTNWLLIGGIAAFIAICCIGLGALLLIPTKSVEGTVRNVYWKTEVPVEEIQAVDYSNEAGSPPSGAYDVSCHDESQEVCEQQTIDKGNGYSEVVEDCHTETEQYCDYTVDEWQVIQTYSLEGNDLQPFYDTPGYDSTDQRIGDKSEELSVTFSTEDGTETYSPGTITEFQKFVIGSVWTLKLNSLGGVVSVEK